MTDSTKGDETGFTLVELLVAIAIMGVMMSAVTGVAVSTLRVEQDQQAMQSTVDQGRAAIQGLRRELRQARRVLPIDDPQPTDRLRFWVDSDQDGEPTGAERICYAVEPLPDGGSGRWQLVRWDDVPSDSDCDPATRSTTGRVLARTLVDRAVFTRVDPAPTEDPYARQTRRVDVRLMLEVENREQISAVEVDASIRLRNVP